MTRKYWCTKTQETLSGWTPSTYIFSLCLSSIHDAQYTHGSWSLTIWIFMPVQKTLVDILHFFVVLNVTVNACYCLQGYVTVWKMRLSLIRRMDYSQVILKQKKQPSFSKANIFKKLVCSTQALPTSDMWTTSQLSTMQHPVPEEKHQAVLCFPALAMVHWWKLVPS